MRWPMIAAAALVATALPATAQTVEGADPAFWSGKADQGAITQLATKAVFPEELAGLKRFRVLTLNAGATAALNYRMDETILSVVVARTGGNPERDLAASIAAIGARSPQAFVWSDGPFEVEASPRLRLFKGTYKTGIGPDTVLDYLYYGRLGGWTVKVRATLPSPKDVADERRLDTAVRALPWAALIAASGGCSGPACRTDRAAAFNAHATELDLSAPEPPPPPPLAGVTAAPPTPPAPLFTRKEGTRDYRLAPIDADLAPYFTIAFGALSVAPPFYALSVAEPGKTTAIVRFFAGAPDRAAFDRAVDGLERVPEQSAFVSAAQSASYADE